MKSKAIRKNYAAALLFVLLTALVCTAAFSVQADAATASVGKATGYISYKNHIALRATPKDSAQVLAAIAPKTKLTILEERFSSTKSRKTKYHWYKVSVGGKVGYVHTNRVNRIQYTVINGKTKYKTRTRLGAGSKMAKGKLLAKGTKVKLYLKVRTKTGGLWYKIKIGTKYYYLPASRVKITSQVPVVSASVSAAQPASSTTSSSSDTASSDSSASESAANGSIPSSNTSIGTTKELPTMGTLSSNQTLRASASSSASKVSSLTSGAKVGIYEEVFTSSSSSSASNKWYKVNVNGKDGYLPSSSVSNIKYTLVSAASTEYINFRSGPNADMPYKGSVDSGCPMQIAISARVNGSSAVWSKVKLGSSYYYIHSAYVKAGKSATSGATYHVLPTGSTQQTHAKAFLAKCSLLGKGIIDNKFTYSNSGVKSTYAAALKYARKTNCGLYVAWCAQEAGLIDKGKTFWLNNKVNGTAASQLKSSSKVTIVYPDILTPDFPFQPGDICGYDWGTNHHTMVYAGKNSKGQPLWYTAGGGDIKAKNLGPVVKSSYDTRAVNVVIRIN